MKIISFNSYKGGACRTTTCYNTLPFLAEALGATAQQPIIVVDCDLDSMGLTSILHAGVKRDPNEKLKYSAKHLFVNDTENINGDLRMRRFTDVREDDWYFQYFERVGTALGLPDNDSILFLGVDENEHTISDDDYNGDKEVFLESSPVRHLIKSLQNIQDENKRPKAIVFDCASGVQMTTLAIFMLTEIAVVCMRPTLQFRIGTREYLYRMLPGQIRNARKRVSRKVILLPTSVAPPATDAESAAGRMELDTLRKNTIKAIKRDIVDFIINETYKYDLGYQLIPDMAELDSFGLPEIERFKWEECLLYKKEALTEQETLLKKRYAELANLLAGE